MADVREKPGTSPARRTHRSASARPVAAAIWAGSAVALIWLLLAGAIGTAVTAAPWLFLASWFAYVGQWRPCLVVDGSGFNLVNGLREHRIPFGTVEDVEVRFSWRPGRKPVPSAGTPSFPARAPGVSSSWNLPDILAGVVIVCWAAVSVVSQSPIR